MPYQSPGSAIVAGIEAGQNFMHRAQDQEDRHQRMQFEMSREDRRDRMEQAHYDFMDRNEADRQKAEAWKEAFQAHKEWGAELEEESNQLQGRFRNPDGTLNMQAAQQDPAYQDYAKRVQKWNQGRDSLMDSAYGPFLKKGIDRANEYANGMTQQNDPKFDPGNPANAQDLHHMVSVATRQDPANFLRGPNGENSPFEDAARDVHNGFSNGDAQALYTGAQAAFGNQFEAGRLGYKDELGGTVTSAGLNPNRPFVPTPDGSAVHPVLQVGGETQDGYTTKNFGAPTQAGFDDPDHTDLMSVTPGKFMDNLGQMGVIQKLLSHPQIQTNLAKAVKNPDQFNQDWAQAYTARGNKPSHGGIHFTRENEDGSVSQMYAPHLPNNNGVGPSSEIVGSRGAPKPSATKSVPEAIQEANQVVADQVVNPATQQPYRNAGEYLAAKARGINTQPNEASIKLQSDIEGDLAEARAGQMKSPLSPTGYVDAVKRDDKGEPIMGDDGKPQVDKAVQAQIDRHIKALEARLESVRKGFNEQGRPQGAHTQIDTGPDIQSPEGQQALDWFERAKKDPRNAGVDPAQLWHYGQDKGKLPKQWMWKTVQPPGAAPAPPTAAAPPSRGINTGGATASF